MKYIRKLLLALLLAHAASAELCAAEGKRGPIFACFDENTIYAAHNNPFGGQQEVFFQPLVGSSEKVNSGSRNFVFGTSPDFDIMHRWRISGSTYYSISKELWSWTLTVRRIPLKDFDLYDKTKPLSDEEWRKLYMKRYPLDHNRLRFRWDIYLIDDLYRGIINEDTPIIMKRVAGEGGPLLAISSDADGVHTDLLPTGKNGSKLFVLDKPRLEVWKGTSEFTEEDCPEHGKCNVWRNTWSKKPVEVIDANFNEPFLVAERGGDYYFITKYCNIYIARKTKQGNRKVELFWKRKDEPIGRVITHIPSGRMFAFTLPLERKDGSFAKPVYFELTDKMETHLYDPKVVPVSKSPYPLKQVREAVDILLKHKRIPDGQNTK